MPNLAGLAGYLHDLVAACLQPDPAARPTTDMLFRTLTSSDVATAGGRTPAPGEPGERLATGAWHALVPPDRALTAAAGIDIAVAYRPPDGGREVPSDWYDVVPIADGNLLLVIGDISGHGQDALYTMDRMRLALRRLASGCASPGELLARLNLAAIEFTEGSVGTVVCGRYQPQAKALHWARAGHLPPVLVRDGIATALDLPEGMPLGVDPDAAYEEAVLELRSDDTLLLYTDGLIERRAESSSDALAGFTALAVPAEEDVGRHVSRIMASAASDTGDDACLLAIRIS
jgi:serine phosphatase RsbU (regulator of sigma subunit)